MLFTEMTSLSFDIIRKNSSKLIDTSFWTFHFVMNGMVLLLCILDFFPHTHSFTYSLTHSFTYYLSHSLIFSDQLSQTIYSAFPPGIVGGKP